MTPIEKAKQLVESMTFSCRECDYEANAKKCALIAVDEILKIDWDEFEMSGDEVMYWQEVKQEIEKL